MACLNGTIWGIKMTNAEVKAKLDELKLTFAAGKF